MSHEPGQFSFMLNFAVGGEPTKVTVYAPKQTGPIPRPGPRVDNLSATLEELLNRLQLQHILREPNPTATLVNQGSYRIDTQPATEVYRNLHYQVNRSSYGVLTVDYGGQLCFLEGYEIRLLKFIKLGLRWSCRDRAKYNIRVTVERKSRTKPPNWIPVASDVAKILKISSAARTKITEVISKRVVSAKNVRQIVQGSDMIEHVSIAIERRIAKITEEQGAHAVAKKIPLVSTFLGLFLGAVRMTQGDWSGAVAEVASGVAADIPGAGTVASLGIDTALLARDIKNAIEDDKKHKKHLEADLERLRQENKQIRKELATILPESEIYGPSCESYFDESELANLEDIRQIKVWCGDIIYAIQVVYRSQSGEQHGGKVGVYKTLDLHPGERIITISGTCTIPGEVISSLTFYTDFCQQKTFGTENGEKFRFEMADGSYLGAIKGFHRFLGSKKIWVPTIGFIPKM